MESQVVPSGDKNHAVEVVYALFLSIAFILVNLRFYVRVRMVKSLWWDDFFLLLGILFSIAAFGVTVARTNPGFGQHTYNLSSKQISSTAQLGLVLVLVFLFSALFTKISICFFLLRIFVTKRRWSRVMYIIMALIVVTYVSSASFSFALCRPITKLWTLNIKGTCLPQESQLGIYYYQGGVAIFTDLLLASLPTYFLKDIQISFRTKFSICALMSLGVFTGICAINRTVSISHLFPSDFAYTSKDSEIWMGLEVNLSIIAAAIPALRPLFATSVRRNLKTRRQAHRPDDTKRLKPTYVVRDQQLEADSSTSRLETCVTAQEDRNQDGIGGELTPLPGCTGILKTSDISVENFQGDEGKWISEHPSDPDRERSVEDVV